MMKKRLLLAVLGLSLVATSANAFAMSQQDARNTASGYVPADAKYTYVAEDKDSFDVFFRSADKTYEVDIDKRLGKVSDVSIDTLNVPLSTAVNISADDAKAAVLKLYPNAKVTKVKLDRDSYKTSYDVKFVVDGVRGDADVLAANGVVLEVDLDYKK